MPASRHTTPVVIADYDPAWPATFERERDAILRVCGDGAFVRIEHVGSTAVPGLAAKPIIDIMPGLRSLDDAPRLIGPLASIGWEYGPETELPDPELNDPGMPFRRYFRKHVDGVRAGHMHMVEVRSDFWRNHLLFRDYLRAHPEEAAAYASLKRELAAQYNASVTPTSNINAGYTTYKTEFIVSRLERARDLVARGLLSSNP